MRSILSFILTYGLLLPLAVLSAPAPANPTTTKPFSPLTSPTRRASRPSLAPLAIPEKNKSPSPDHWTPGPIPNIGDVVGVRPGAYEGKSAANKKVTIHPGVVISGPHPETGKYQIAMISKKLPHSPPRADIRKFHKHTTLYGDVSLAPPVEVHAKDTKSWKSKKTGHVEKPMDKEGVERLKAAMKPHAGWKKLPTPPPPSPKQSKKRQPPAPHPNSGRRRGGIEVHPVAGPSRPPRQSRPPNRSGPYPNQRQRQDSHRGRSPGPQRGRSPSPGRNQGRRRSPSPHQGGRQQHPHRGQSPNRNHHSRDRSRERHDPKGKGKERERRKREIVFGDNYGWEDLQRRALREMDVNV
ncbi:unnamed protein product [Cyclocybe aegerita]|uniref:Uncharacterized protein n=1 Tax=Cyclocybe aegerita TaxID=1973307 RepID=A0A8S0W3V7_CYCAE|nr:unnamed protein product [Cyclocybe aegerita]